MFHSNCYKYIWKKWYWFERNCKLLLFGISTSLFLTCQVCKRYHCRTLLELPDSDFLDISNKLTKMPPTFHLLPRCYTKGAQINLKLNLICFIWKHFAYILTGMWRNPFHDLRAIKEYSLLFCMHTLYIHSCCTAN